MVKYQVYELEGQISELCDLVRYDLRDISSPNSSQSLHDTLNFYAINNQTIQRFKIGSIEDRKLTSNENVVPISYLLSYLKDLSVENGRTKISNFLNLILTYTSEGIISIRDTLDKKKAIREMRYSTV
jgi:hypothetical protein